VLKRFHEAFICIDVRFNKLTRPFFISPLSPGEKKADRFKATQDVARGHRLKASEDQFRDPVQLGVRK
jgi:hypothetical protein